jgi:hypothetical protein
MAYMKKMRKTKMRSKKNARKTKRIRGGGKEASKSMSNSAPKTNIFKRAGSSIRSFFSIKQDDVMLAKTIINRLKSGYIENREKRTEEIINDKMILEEYIASGEHNFEKVSKIYDKYYPA